MRSFLTVDPDENTSVIVGLSSPLRLRILRLLRTEGPLNVNEIAARMGLPQSTIATNVGILGEAELIRTETSKARKGQQKVCAARYDEDHIVGLTSVWQSFGDVRTVDDCVQNLLQAG